jgi:hypothetical protein
MGYTRGVLRPAVLLCLLTLAGCADLPRDPDGTLERVRREHRFAVGLVDGATAPPVLGRIARETNARPVLRRGQPEPLLLELEAGRLDLVAGGRFDAKSPWSRRVTLGEPLGRDGEHLVARNGENAWIMLVHRAVRAR